MTPLVLVAAEYAARAHAGQERKYTGEPYIVHPIAVARSVLEHGGDEDMVCAALLHDVVEDTPRTHADVLTHFGARITQLVMEVTKVSKAIDGNREVRVAKDNAHYATASPGGQTIKLADLIDNSRTILLHDRDFAKVYFREKRDLLATMTRGDGRLYYTARRLVDEFFANEEIKA
jgi:(p)ppGpp synthase/HD superfamily hydrolase